MSLDLVHQFFFCPNTGRVIDTARGDDKALCECGRSNPRVPTEATERTGTHIVRFLQPATLNDWREQNAAKRSGS